MSHELGYHPGADQKALGDAFNRSLRSLLPISRLHCDLDESADTWAQLDAIGLFTIAMSEQDGGSGLGATEEALIVMELGRCLASPSILASIAATHASATSNGTALPPQRTAAAWRHDDRIVAVDDADARRLLIRSVDSASLHPIKPALNVLDDQLWTARIVELAEPSQTLAVVDAAGLLRLRLIDAAALAGIAEIGLEMAVAYASERKQFGRAIGSFQAVKHHCANMAIAARSARDQTCFAATAIDHGRDDAALQVECALLVAGSAALQNAATNIQIHGGIGFSDEAAPHLLLKRARLIAAMGGGLEAANERIAMNQQASRQHRAG